MGVLRTAGERIREYKRIRLPRLENVAARVKELVSVPWTWQVNYPKSPLHVTDAVVRDRCPTPQSPSQGCKLCPEKNLPDSKARQLARPLCHWGLPFWDKAVEKRPLVFSVVAQACMPSASPGSNGARG